MRFVSKNNRKIVKDKKKKKKSEKLWEETYLLKAKKY